MKDLATAATTAAKALEHFNVALHDVGNDIASRHVLAAMASRSTNISAHRKLTQKLTQKAE